MGNETFSEDGLSQGAARKTAREKKKNAARGSD